MRFGSNNASAARVPIILAAIFLGVAIGIAIVPNTVLSAIRPSVFSFNHLIVAAIGIAVFIALVLAYLGSTVDRSHQLDRDLLDAFFEHIPDNVFFKDTDSRFLRISRAMANYCGLKDPALSLIHISR